MIDVSTAKRLLAETVKPLPARKHSLSNAADCILARDLFALSDNPRFDQSAVDGFAIVDALPVVTGPVQYPVAGELPAGSAPVKRPKPGHAYRIFTGATVPQESLCVVMQEQVLYKANMIELEAGLIKDGANIRRKGNHFRKGELLLKKGSLLNPAAVGLIASQGADTVNVFPKPVIGILVTGDELIAPGSKVPPGFLFESNSWMLEAALAKEGFKTTFIRRCADRPALLKATIRKMLAACDMLIVTGGISVGKYDFVKEILTGCGVHKIFHKVSQKPGKPLYAGAKGRKMVFGLPGNPAAVLVCFHQYVLPCLHIQSGYGQDSAFPAPLRKRMAHEFLLKGDRDQFLRGRYGNEGIVIDSSQDSDNLYSFASSEALIHVPSGITRLLPGDSVDTFPIHQRLLHQA